MNKLFSSIFVVLSCVRAAFADTPPESTCYQKVMAQALKSLPYSNQVDLVVGATNVDHYIFDFGIKNHACKWRSSGFFAGRYQFYLEVPLTVDESSCAFVGPSDEIRVQINEVAKVGVVDSRLGRVTYSGQWVLNGKQWSDLVASRGDWSAVGVPIVTNSPIENFEVLEKHEREANRRLKKSFDAPDNVYVENLRRTAKHLAEDAEAGRKVPEFPDRSHATSACYKAIYDQTRTNAIFQEQFESFFGASNVDNVVSGVELQGHLAVRHTVAYFNHRYRISMHLPLLIDGVDCRCLGAGGGPIFRVQEFTKIENPFFGDPVATMGSTWDITLDEWTAFIGKNGNWTATRVSILANSPVPGFEKFVRWERTRGVRKRQDDFDAEVRKAIEAQGLPGDGIRKDEL